VGHWHGRPSGGFFVLRVGLRGRCRSRPRAGRGPRLGCPSSPVRPVRGVSVDTVAIRLNKGWAYSPWGLFAVLWAAKSHSPCADLHASVGGVLPSRLGAGVQGCLALNGDQHDDFACRGPRPTGHVTTPRTLVWRKENAQLRQAVDSHATVDQAIGVLTAIHRLARLPGSRCCVRCPSAPTSSCTRWPSR
jgi:hypothetical protein